MEIPEAPLAYNNGYAAAVWRAGYESGFKASTEPPVENILTLAAIIREVDGSNSLGAAALAEQILQHPHTRALLQYAKQQGTTKPTPEDIWALYQQGPGTFSPVAFAYEVLEQWGNAP